MNYIEYKNFIMKCSFIAKKDSPWFIPGTNVIPDNKPDLTNTLDDEHTFEDGLGVFKGWTNEHSFVKDGIEDGPKWDSELCELSEFDIYDPYNNRINDIKIKDYVLK